MPPPINPQGGPNQPTPQPQPETPRAPISVPGGIPTGGPGGPTGNPPSGRGGFHPRIPSPPYVPPFPGQPGFHGPIPAPPASPTVNPTPPPPPLPPPSGGYVPPPMGGPNAQPIPQLGPGELIPQTPSPSIPPQPGSQAEQLQNLLREMARERSVDRAIAHQMIEALNDERQGRFNIPLPPAPPGSPTEWSFTKALIESVLKLNYVPLLTFASGKSYVSLIQEKLRLMEEIDRSAILDREAAEREDRLSPLERTRERLARYPSSLRPMLEWRDP